MLLLGGTGTTTPDGSPASAGDEPGEPLEHVPTIPTKQDAVHYLGILAPLAASLNEDMMDALVYLDPYEEHRKYRELLDDASELDGCYQGFDCPGWKDAPDLASSLSSYATLDLTSQSKLKAAIYRKQAWEHYVNFRYMEQRLLERCGDIAVKDEDFCMPKSHIKVENQLWRDWQAFRERFASYSKWVMDVTLIKESDFVEVQRFDLELQKFRQRFRDATGLNPSSPWPKSPPEEGALTTLAAALKMLTGAAVVFGGIYLGTKLFSGERRQQAPQAPQELPAAKSPASEPTSEPTSTAPSSSPSSEETSEPGLEPEFA
jgi:hypothetical protein